MAISLEELAVGALEGSAGPWTLAVGAGALAMALAAGSARPLRRMTATAVHAADRTGQLRYSSWFGALWRGWCELVEEARAEYEADRRAGLSVVTSMPQVVPTPAVVVEPTGLLVGQAPRDASEADGTLSGPRRRNQRGRFIRRSDNGTRPE